MKLRKRILSFILSVSMFGILVPSMAFAEDTTEGTTPEETISDTFEVTINPRNYATVLLTTDATGHNSKDKVGVETQYAYVNSSTIKKAFRAYTFITEFKIPLKAGLTSMLFNEAMYKEGTKTKAQTIRYVTSKIKTDSDDTMPTMVSGTYQGSYTKTVNTGETDADGNPITTTEDVVSPTNAEYQKWYNYGYQFWQSSLITSAGTVPSSAASNEPLSLDFSATAMVGLKNSDSDYLTFGTARAPSSTSRFYFIKIPTLTLTYSRNDILTAINTSQKSDLPELFADLDDVGLMANTATGYTGYTSLIDIAKDYVEEEITEDITNGGYADLDTFYTAYDEAVTFATQNGTLIAINNVKSVEEMALIIEELGATGSLENSENGYVGFTSLSNLMEKQVIAELYEILSQGEFETIDSFLEAYDEAVNSAKELTSEDAVTAEISPENYASIHITDSGHHGYSRAERVFYNTPYADNVKFYAESGSVITSYKVMLKDMLSAMAVNYSINTAGQMQNGHVPVFYDINKFDLGVPAGKYDMIVEEAPEEVTPSVVSEEGGDEGYGEEEEEPEGSVDIPSEGENPEDVTKDVYKEVLNYTSNYWPESGYSYSNNKVAYRITSSSTGRMSHDITNTALKALLADNEAEYLTLAMGRETSGYINFSVNLSEDGYIPTLTLSYDAAKLVDLVNSAEKADDFEEIIEMLGKAEILDNSEYGYAGYSGVGAKYKKQINEALFAQVADGGYLKFSDFIDKYDEAVLFVANNVINNPDVYINFNDNTANDASGNNKNATIVGDASFVEGPDGTAALKVENTFGKAAEQYLNMGEYDFSEDSFSIVFWMKAPGRGVKYEESGDSITAGTPVDFSTYTGTSGGVVLSNKDFSVNGNTGFAFAAMPIYADFSFNMKVGENPVSNTVGVQTAIDSRWHQISYVVNRQGKASFYVDNTLTKEVDVSKLSGTLGIGNLVFGADGLGQYGMNKGEFDDIRIYSAALEASKIEELYYMAALNKVNNEVEDLLEGDDATYYSEANIDALEEKLAESKAFAGGYKAGEKDALIAQFNAIDEYFNTFLNKEVKGVAAWGSDVHISENNESHLNAQNLKRFLTESANWENPAKTFIISGDLADVGADDLRYFFNYLDKWVVEGVNVALCRGNHDEPSGSEKDTGTSHSRTELKDMYVAWMDKYVDKTNSLNAGVVDSEGKLKEPFYYSTDGVAHYISVDLYWPTARSISDSQIAWLKTVLDNISGDGKPIFFIQHAPLYGTHPNVEGDKNRISKEADTKIKNLVKNYDNIFILTGHHHAGLGAGAGNPYKVKLDDGTETGAWLINTTLMCSKTISRGYEWAGGYYINIYEDKVLFRARDFENQKWLREYDLSFDLVPAEAKTEAGEIKLTDLLDSTEYEELEAALDKNVKVQVPVSFAKGDSFETILSFYNGTTLISAELGEVSVNDQYIEFETKIPANATSMKVMCWDSAEGMIPAFEAVSK